MKGIQKRVLIYVSLLEIHFCSNKNETRKYIISKFSAYYNQFISFLTVIKFFKRIALTSTEEEDVHHKNDSLQSEASKNIKGKTLFIVQLIP